MAWNDFLKRPKEAKESAVGSVLVLNPGQPKWMPKDVGGFAREGYQQNVVVFQAINRIADAVASVKWQVWRNDDVMTEHPLLDLLDRPNPMQGGDEFMRAKIGFLMIAGNGYDEKVMLGNEPRELYTHRPDRMKLVPSTTGVPERYIYANGNRKVEFDCDPDTGESLIRHFKLFHPTDDWYGMSPIEAGAYAVDQHNEAMRWMQALLQNSARPSGAITTGNGETLDPDTFNRLKKQIEEQYSGSENAGRPMLLEGGMDWKAMGLSPSDMAILETKYSAARDVCLAFGVPPQLLGIPGDNTYSNYQEARLAFWEDTVIPLVNYICDEWNAWLAPHWEGVYLAPDLDSIPAIADKRASMWAMVDAATDLTLNERRRIKGLEEIDGGDIVPLNDAAMTNIRSLVQSVADGIMPTDSAVALVRMAHPSLPPDVVSGLFANADGFSPMIDFAKLPNDQSGA